MKHFSTKTAGQYIAEEGEREVEYETAVMAAIAHDAAPFTPN
jgi:hypothetical protein